jgi:hypothetical protein
MPRNLTTREARRMARMRKTHSGGRGPAPGTGGRPRSTRRCPCGAMTRERARKRNHRC